MILLKIFIALYAVMSMMAVFSDYQHNGPNWLHILYMGSSLILLLSMKDNHSAALLIVGLVGLMIAAFMTGLVAHDFHWSHHIIRLIVSAAIVALFFYLKK